MLGTRVVAVVWCCRAQGPDARCTYFAEQGKEHLVPMGAGSLHPDLVISPMYGILGIPTHMPPWTSAAASGSAAATVLL